MTQHRAEETKAAILLATVAALNDRSYDTAPLASIVASAGVTTGAFYFHFASREQAAWSILEAYTRYSQMKMLRVYAAERPALLMFIECSAGLIVDVLSDPVVRAGSRLTAEVGLLGMSPAVVWRSWADMNIDQFTIAVAEGDLHANIDVLCAAEAFVSDLVGIYLRCELKQDFTALRRQVHFMWRRFIAAHATNPARWYGVLHELFEVRAPRRPLALEEVKARHALSLFRARPVDFALDAP